MCSFLTRAQTHEDDTAEYTKGRINFLMENSIISDVEESEEDGQNQQTKCQPETSKSSWSNGQCVVAVQSVSMFNPSFDLSLCRSKLQRDGFEIPVSDLEAPLNTALNVPSVRRFMVFNSALFHFLLAPVLYVLVWCSVFSTLHLSVSDYWVLCLSVSLVSIFLTAAIVFILHNSNKEVNEKMVKHKLLVGIADWVQNCTGNMKLYFMYWDMSPCLRALTETLEEQNFATSNKQNKLKSRMSHLVLVAEEVPACEDPEAEGSHVDEQRPLLRNGSTDCSNTCAKFTSTFSLVPETSLPAQDQAYQLLMGYSATYVKLLVSERLSGVSRHHLRSQMNHCATGPLCLCQYITTKLLQ
ncbi:transmembrane protein 268 isoform X2 [Gouania willdenowi]|uniref:transmembrane protein 268 isoform X2 n=1 Tax=Gouania willdenowi TaxID=441366 RepID=UPI001054E293|nr:transmembrane protein 268 isoform X2 [Gouania willdenowi]